MSKHHPRPLPRIALSKAEAAESLGMSPDSFERYVQPHMRVIRKGKLRLFRMTDLERWADENAAPTLAGAQ